MKKFLSALFILGSLYSSAAPLTPEAALEAALNSRPGRRAISANRNENQSGFKLTKTVDDGCAYIFQTAGGEFLIAAGDDSAVYPLIGYGTQLPNTKKTVPPAMEWLIKGLTSRPMRKSESNVTRENISPMVTARWNQDEPFNNDCPIERRSKTMTGCEATAAAQILYYFKYPAQGVGTASYTWQSSYGGSKILTFNYEENPFDWDNMLDIYIEDEYTEEQGAAVANLMYGLGVGMNMKYGYIQSGCYDIDGSTCLINYFNYDKRLTLPMGEFYTVDEWTDMIYEELAQQRPLLYTGSTIFNEGHAFVCDGYDGAEGDYFHINWGWGGSYDGYFLLTALDPEGQGIGGGSGAFTEANSIFKGMMPDEGGEPGILYYYLGEPFFSSDSMTRNKRDYVEVKFNGESSFGNIIGIYYFGVCPSPLNMTLKFTDVETGEYEYTHISFTSTISYGTGFDSLPLSPSEFPEEGTYLMEIGYMNQGEWEKMFGEPDSRRDLYVACTESNIYFGVDTPPTIPIKVEMNLADKDSENTLYYDLQGRPLTSPVNGIYLKKQGNTFIKVCNPAN